MGAHVRTFVKSKLKDIERRRDEFNAELDRERERFLVTMSVLDEIDTDALRAQVEKDAQRGKKTVKGETDE